MIYNSIAGSINVANPLSCIIDAGGISFGVAMESFKSKLIKVNDVSELLDVEKSGSLRITSSEPGDGHSDPAKDHSSMNGERPSDSMLGEGTEITSSRREKVGNPFNNGSNAGATVSVCADVIM